MHHNARDLTGQVFGRLTAIRQTSKRDSSGNAYWECSCSCGGTKEIRTVSLTSANGTRSCGCANRERMARSPRLIHGHARDGNATTVYTAWKSMIHRCFSPNNKHFARYGGRGISVCERWRDFRSFAEDMGECPPGTSLDRINNEGNYEPGNCRWATQREQTRNTSQNRHITMDGITMCVTDWAERVGISRDTLASRLRAGWDVKRALTQPTGR